MYARSRAPYGLFVLRLRFAFGAVQGIHPARPGAPSPLFFVFRLRVKNRGVESRMSNMNFRAQRSSNRMQDADATLPSPTQTCGAEGRPPIRHTISYRREVEEGRTHDRAHTAAWLLLATTGTVTGTTRMRKLMW